MFRTAVYHLPSIPLESSGEAWEKHYLAPLSLLKKIPYNLIPV
jgi:hypothetical protein